MLLLFQVRTSRHQDPAWHFSHPKNSRIASTALSSPKSRRIDGPPPHSRSGLILCYILLISGPHLLHLAKR